MQATPALYTLMIGTNDVNVNGAGPYEAVYNTCYKALLAWLVTPREGKVLPGDAAFTSQAGGAVATVYGSETRANIARMTAAGTLRATINTGGKPLYLWHFLDDANPGTFTVSIDGGSALGPYSCQVMNGSTPVLVGPTHNGSTASVALTDRIPVGAGSHTVDFIWQSGVVGIVGVGSLPANPLYTAPVVAAMQIILQNQTTTEGLQHNAATAIYNADVLNNIAVFVGDGADVRYVPAQNYLHSDAAHMNDDYHPNAAGHVLLSQAVEQTLQLVPNTAGGSGAVPTKVSQLTNDSGYQTAANVTSALASPPPIGGTTPGAGSFTTLSATNTSTLANIDACEHRRHSHQWRNEVYDPEHRKHDVAGFPGPNIANGNEVNFAIGTAFAPGQSGFFGWKQTGASAGYLHLDTFGSTMPIVVDGAGLISNVSVSSPRVYGTKSGGASFNAVLFTPASSSAAGKLGDYCDDANYHYVCVKDNPNGTVANAWRRVALNDF